MDLESKYKIDLNNSVILTAFTHSSYNINGNDCETYQRLEFLGDKVMGYIISEYLYRNYNVTEGKMSSMLSNYVCKNAHYSYSLELGLDKYLRTDPNNYDNLCKNENILADIFESFIGAVKEVYGLSKVYEIVYDIVIPKIDFEADEFLQDYKTKIFSYFPCTVSYKIIKEEIKEDNKILYTCDCFDNYGDVIGTGCGYTKKSAEQNAAKNAIELAEKGI